MQGKTLAASAAILLSLISTAPAAVWGFGDSNIDTGWFTTAPYSGEASFDTYLSQASLYGIGKQTNNPGPISIEVLASLLNVTALPANRPGGTNYATSGAKDFATNTTANGGFPNAVPTLTQFSHFVNAHRARPNDIVVIDSGANDISYASTLDPTSQQSYLEGVAVEFAKAIKALQIKGGAAHLIVADQPESFGTAQVQSLRHLYNTTLRSNLNSLGVVYAWGDRNRVRQDIVANPAHFDMLYTDNSAHVACPGGPQAGFSTDWAILCSANSPVITPASFAQQTLFADDGHWASNGQKVLGSYYYCLVRLHWPTLIPVLPVLPVSILKKQPYACSLFSEFARRPFPL
jgi:phospholipase/lecithinase/hemolysin